MKVGLMYENSPPQQKKMSNEIESDLKKDLEITTLCNAMALKDKFLFDIAMDTILFSMSNNLSTILYRQNILMDCLQNPTIIKQMYALTTEAIESQRHHFYGIFMRYPSSILSSSMDMLFPLLETLKKLRDIAEENTSKFQSSGFRRFFAMLKREITDEYLSEVSHHIGKLKFRNGILMGVKLGKFNKGENYTLRKPDEGESWFKSLFAKKTNQYTFSVDPSDQNGLAALSQLEGMGLNLVANALAQSTDHVIGFFNVLRAELAFYIGCLNLRDQIMQLDLPFSFPLPSTVNDCEHEVRGLYDICLALNLRQHIVGNYMKAININVIVITGANQGGKSTFLRSIGLAQLMMQSGMFVPAEFYRANLCTALFTHYKREEDVSMKSGKFDEELNRMSKIADHIRPHAMLLLNESFAATNEREGAEIANQIISALIEKDIKVFFVTHLYEYAHTLYDKKLKNVLFLRAERELTGKRTFKLKEDIPLQTSYGEDLYKKIFLAEG